MRAKEKAIIHNSLGGQDKGKRIGIKPDILLSRLYHIKKSEGIIMKRNLIIVSILIGGLLTVLPLLVKILIFTGLALYLFTAYDEYDYQLRVGGRK